VSGFEEILPHQQWVAKDFGTPVHIAFKDFYTDSMQCCYCYPIAWMTRVIETKIAYSHRIAYPQHMLAEENP
jgi:hypothetical protein